MRSDIPEIGDLQVLLDADAAARAFRGTGHDVVRVQPRWWRAPSDKSATVLYDAEIDVSGKTTPTRLYAKTWSADEAPRVADKWSRLKPLAAPDGGSGVALLPSEHSVLFFFPNDGGLRLMREAIDLDRLKRRLVLLGGPFAEPWRVRGSKSKIDVVRWKPEHRCVVRVELAMKNDATEEKKTVVAYLRIFDDESGDRLHGLLTALSRSDAAAHVPTPLGAFANGSVYVEASVPGPNLSPTLILGKASGAEVGRALARLHRTPIDARRTDPTALSVHRCGELLSVQSIAPEIVEGLRRHFTTPAPEPFVDSFLHGDLHPEQIILAPGGPVFLDFERAARGDPLIDVGNFTAHLLTMPDDSPHRVTTEAFLADFLSAYRETAPRFSDRALARNTAIGLVQWAATRHRHRILEPTEHLDRALVSALSILDRGTIGR